MFLRNIDPISYLEISRDGFSEEELLYLRKSLREKMSQYLFIKIADELEEDQVKQLLRYKAKDQITSKLQEYFPNLNEKIKKYLEEFKKEFNDK